VCEDHYLPNEFNYISYEASSGGLSCPDSDARMNYYGMSGIPDLRFDGNWHIQVGAPESDANGQAYIAIIDSHRAVEAPLAVVVSDYSYEIGSAFVEVKVKMFADIGSPANHYIRVAVIEDNLVYNGVTYDNTCRDVLPQQALTISAPGEEQIVNLPIPMSAAWHPEDLMLIAFVQRDTDRYIINSGNSKVGEYAAIAGATGPQQVMADGGQIVFDETTVLNIGLLTDTFDISIDTSNLRGGWGAQLLRDGSETSTFSVTLAPFESASFNVVMDTGTTGSGSVAVNVYSQGAGENVQTLIFAGIAGGTDLLVVADDDGSGLGYTAYGPSLAAAGATYSVWERSLAPITGSDLLAYDAVIWESGAKSNSMLAADRSAIDAYLAAGGRLILAGEDLLQGAVANGGSAWIQLKLRLSYGSGDSGNLQVNGVAGDPIGDGQSFTLTGGDPDQVNLITGQPVEACYRFGNPATTPAGTRTTYGTYLVVYLPFGLERMPADGDREIFLARALQWLGLLETVAVEDVPGAGPALAQNAPNPFNPTTKISFRTGRSGPARLDVFNARGQLVRVLVDGVLAAGVHEAIWDGTTQTGQQAASGTYFYRLRTTDDELTRKMSLVK